MSAEKVKNLLLVASGKGGVGKSTVATNLALALAQSGAKTGLLDADVYGPSVPIMLGAAKPERTEDGEQIRPIQKHGLSVISMGYFLDGDAPVIWRGPMLANAVTQLVNDVAWGDLDYLIFDLPPGTGDIQLTLSQKFKVTGSVLVTTPQTVALADVVRAKAMFDKVDIPSLGIIENMSYFVCSSCSERHEIFSHGGGERAAEDLDVPFIGRIPIETAVREASDMGEPIVIAAPESESARAFAAIAERLQTLVEKTRGEKKKQERLQNALRIIS